MNPFTEHPHQQGLTYKEHLEFALGIAWRLFNVVIAFSLHAILPFIGIKHALDLEQTANFINDCNNWIENKKLQETIKPIRSSTFKESTMSKEQLG
jgi:hypothetical protein